MPAPDRNNCTRCTAAVYPDETFCGSCGAALTAAATEPSHAGRTETRSRLTAAGPIVTTPCRGCGTKLTAEELFCPTCGTASGAAAPAGDPMVPCQNCGTVVGPGDLFCPNCGTLRAGATPPTQAQTASPDTAWLEVLGQLRAATAGEFEVVRELGRGGMAAVFLAHEAALGRDVAIKVMSPMLAFNDGAVDRFDHEARTMAALKHPNIVTIHAVRTKPVHYFVMEYVSGSTIDAITRRIGPWPIAAIQAVVHEVASALGHAHRQNVVHRDIKGSNILIDRSGHAIVSDFGIAKVLVGTSTLETGHPIGTPQFISPEQLLMARVSGASDQYSFGILLFEMLTGAVPFTGSRVEVEQAHLSRVPPRVGAIRPDCPGWMADAVARMLAKEPGDRFGSIEEAAKAMAAQAVDESSPVRHYLARAAAGEAPAAPWVPPAAPGVGGRPAPRRRSVVFAGSAVVASIAGVALAAWLVGKWNGDVDRPIDPRRLTSVRFSTQGGSVRPGDSVPLVAASFDQHGAALESAVSFRSQGPGVVAIAGGYARFANPGVAWVLAQAGSITDSIRFEVVEPEGSEPAGTPKVIVVARGTSVRVAESALVAVVVRDAGGAPLAGSGTTVAVDDPTIVSARLQPGGIRLVGAAEGRTTVRLRAGAARAAIEVSVSRPALASLTIDPVPDSLVVGQRHRFSGRGTDDRGQPIALRTPGWDVAPRDRAMIDRDGWLTAAAAGEVVVTLETEGRRTNTTVRIAPPSVGVIAAGPGAEPDREPVKLDADAAKSAISARSRAVVAMIAAKDQDRLGELYRPEAGTDPGWKQRLLAALPDVVTASLVGETIEIEDKGSASAAVVVRVTVRDPVVRGTTTRDVALLLRYSRLGDDWNLRGLSLTRRPPF